MLKILIKKQITETLIHTFRKGSIQRGEKNGRKDQSREKGILLLMIFAILYLFASSAFFSHSFCKTLSSVGLLWLFYLIISGAAIIFGTFGSIFSTCFTLYMAKDNDLLLSMPIPLRTIILSRLFNVYFMGLLYSGLISIPAVIVSWFVVGFSLSRSLGGLALIFLVSLIVLALSCLLGWVVAKISQRLKNRSFLTVLIALLFAGLYYVVYYRLMNLLRDLLGVMIRVGEVIRSSAYPLYTFGRIGEGDLVSMLCWTAAVLLLLTVIWLPLKKTFLAITTATPTPKRAVYQEKKARLRSASSALLYKEWYRFSSSANYMLNCGMPLLLLLGSGIYMLMKGKFLFPLLAALGRPEFTPVLLCSICCVLSSMVDISTPSISLEGRSLWQLQCLPVTPWQVLRAKLSLHLALVAVPALFCTLVCLILAPISLLQKLLLLTVSVLNTILFALFGLFLGLKLPNLSWTSEIVPIKQSVSVFMSVFSGIGASLAFAGLYLLFGWHLGASLWMGIFAVLYLIADIALYLWLRGPGSRRFAAL